MQNAKSRKAACRATIIGYALMMVTVLLTGIMGISKRTTGFKAAMKNYWGIWQPNTVATPITYFAFIIFLFAIALFVALAVVAIIKRRGLLIVTALGLCLAIAFIPFLLLFILPQVEAGTMGRLAFYVLSFVSLLNLLAIVVLYLPLKALFATGLTVFTGAEEEEQPVQSTPVVEEKAAAGLEEKEVREIVEEYIENHKEELHKREVVVEKVIEKPVEEPVEEEEDEEEEEEFEEVEELDAQGNLVKIKRKKRVPFETRLRKSEFDIRHKYYDLRDYIKWYGLNNRISIPGDTFSLKRKKYFFITIVGKHIKFFASTDAKNYEDSPIPVEKATAKKYVDTPCCLRIKSDLSYRRAKQIVDDVMMEAGFAKPEGPEPKETQH